MNRGDLVADLFHEVGRFSLFFFYFLYCCVFLCTTLSAYVRTSWGLKMYQVVLIRVVPDSVVPVDIGLGFYCFMCLLRVVYIREVYSYGFLSILGVLCGGLGVYDMYILTCIF